MLFGNVAHLPLKEDFAAAREMGTNCKLPHSYKWNQMAREIPVDFGYLFWGGMESAVPHIWQNSSTVYYSTMI